MENSPPCRQYSERIFSCSSVSGPEKEHKSHIFSGNISSPSITYGTGLVGNPSISDGGGIFSTLFSNSSFIFYFNNTPLPLLLPYCPKSNRVKQYFESQIAKNTMLKKPLSYDIESHLN